MKKKDLKKSCYGPKGDRKVEVLRTCLGKKKKRSSGGKGGIYIVLGGRRVIAITVLRIGKDALDFKEGSYGRMKR
jgi:hypothetical protein